MGCFVPILMYHQVMPNPPRAMQTWTVTPHAFTRQMRWLAKRGYTTVSMDELVACRAGEMDLPERPIIITFDDGYQGSVDYAVPVLQQHGFSAIIYLVTDCVGGSSHWLQQEIGLEFPMMDWATARALERAGFACGAHTRSHPRLTDISDDACRLELVESRATLTRELGHPIYHLAYPYGRHNPRVTQLATEAGYRTACTVRQGLSGREPLMELRRIEVRGIETLLDFAAGLHLARPFAEVWRFRRTIQRQRRPQRV